MSRGTKLCLSSLVLMVGIAWFGRDVWLEALGRYLTATSAELGSSADYAVVPASDDIRADVHVETLEEAVRLLRAGRVKHIVMSCPDWYGSSECELAETALRDRGYLGARIEWLRTERLPDEMEADKTIRWLRERGTKSAIILLPNYKARRLGGAYRRLGVQSGIEVSVSAQNGDFDPQRWWRSREEQKRFAEELVRLTRLL
jgi:hypothetical protein